MAATTTTAVARPQLVEPGKDEAPKIQHLLQRKDTIAKFQQIVPRHLNPDRLLRVMAHACYKVPKLYDCEPVTLLGAMMAAASLGLEPNTPLGHAYLIPFESRRKVKDPKGGRDRWETKVDVQLIIGYRGYIDLARRSGSLVSIHADVVYKGDEFSFEYGSDMHLRHRPKGLRDGRTPEWAYAHAKLADGQAFEVLPYPQVLKIRDNSQGYRAALAAREAAKEPGQEWKRKTWDTSPWVAFEHEMAVKTMVRQVAKWLPMSLEFANAAALDSMSEAGRVDFGAIAQDPEGALIDVETVTRDAPAAEPEQESAQEDTGQQQAEKPAQAEADAQETTEEGRQAAQAETEAPAAKKAAKPNLFGK